MMDKESLNLVNEAYKDAKDLLQNYYDKLIEFSELLKNNTVVMSTDVIQFSNL
jgi:ATP-dependent Zn protease